MPSRVAFYREVYGMIQERMRATGMRRHSIGIFSRTITTDATGVVRLNAATKYRLEINPLIGVQYLPLEHLLAELKERPFHPINCGDTIARPIGYLGPAHMFWTWKFEEGRDNGATVAEMVEEITTIGFRYMEHNCTLEKVCERIAVDHHVIRESGVYTLPVGYMMLGRFDDAEKVVRNELAKMAAHRPLTIEEHEARQGEKLLPHVVELLEKLKDQPLPAHVNYRRFAERFFRRLDEERRRVGR